MMVLARTRQYRRAFMLALQENLEYRGNFLLEGAVNLISFVVQYFLWRSVYETGGGREALQGYTLAQMITYVILAHAWAQIAGASEVDEGFTRDVRDGGLSRYLLRPMSDLGHRLSTYLGHKSTYAVLRFSPVIAILVLFRSAFHVTPTAAWFYLPIACFMALLLQFAFSYCFAMVAFWWLEVWGLLFLKSLLANFLSGGWFPLDLVPDALMTWLSLLPFQYVVFFPTQIFLGRLTVAQIHHGLLMQVVWIVVLFAAQQVLWRRGLRRYAAAGG